MIYGIILLFFILSFIIIILAKSNALINILTIFNSLIAIVTPIYLFVYAALPISLLSNNYVSIDALSLYEILIAGVIFFLASIYAKGYVFLLVKENELKESNIKLFYLAYNLLFISTIGVFVSNNLALLWIFAEITTIISAVLIVVLNAKENIIAAIKYIFITSTAMLFSLVGLVFLFAASKSAGIEPTLNWNELLQVAGQISPQLLLFSFVLIYIGFAAKSGIVPFHAWLPPSHAKAASDVSVLLSSVVLNIGIYAIIRMYSLIHPTIYGQTASNVLLVFGIITVGIAGFSMPVRRNIKKLIAFSSIENMGFILIGVAVGNLFWTLFYVLAHALTKALLFFSAGIIHRQYGSVKVGEIRNVLKLQPLAATGLIIGSIAIIGTPLFPIFIPKFFIIASLSKVSLSLAFILLMFILIAASSFVWFILRIVTEQGNTPEKYPIFINMKMPIVILIIMLLLLGVYMPKILFDFLNVISSQLGFGGL
ncbi:MAG: proton-conducting transporter membrane subunit [Methanocellales archaeon]|nr:proton-conducting transporter membrane subunit [Methanocellales archaeon]MDD3420691.1 proton-conducting transporter membrane subunit [Methanocellales archaeon]MDD4897863.1 proton-conducting transporter membrane subunit [Methanocellales archaeon]MDD5446429.1 proton-conducting transporter membrane subunit [Methanocellales archaeon]